MNVAISTLTLRHNRMTGSVTFPLHRRDSALVGHAGGMYQVLPVGVFQPAGEESWNTSNDFSLWRCIIRELAEELRGNAEGYDTHRGPIDYDAWPFADQLSQALATAQVRGHCCIGGHRKRAGWVDASSPCPSVRAEIGLRRVSVPAGGDHLGGPVVPALRALVP